MKLMDLKKYVLGALRSPWLFKYTRELEKRLEWSRQEMDDYQARCLIELVNFCYKTVPFYRDLWNKHGIDIRKIQSPEDLKLLPHVTKEDIRKNSAKFISENLPGWEIHTHQTGGSTSRPMQYSVTLDSRMQQWAFYLRYWHWHDMDWWHSPTAVIRGPRENNIRNIDRNIKRNLINNSYNLWPFNYTEEKVRDYAEFIVNKKIEYIIGYPSLLEPLGRVIEKDSKLRDRLSIKKIFCTAETLYPPQRKFIEKAFNSTVSGSYGHREMAAFFPQCPSGEGYHIVSDYGYAEFDALDDKSGLHEIIATGFLNKAMPLVRYRTRDYVQLLETDTCSCGLPFPKIVKNIEGRSGDIIITPKGQYLSPTYICQVDRFFVHFADIQIRQDAIDHIMILIKPDPEYTEEDGNRFIEALHKRIGESMDITVKLVDNIERSVAQKKRLVVSEVKDEFLKK